MIKNSCDFCLESEEKSAKFSVGNAKDSLDKYSICGEEFGSIEIELRTFVRKTRNCWGWGGTNFAADNCIESSVVASNCMAPTNCLSRAPLNVIHKSFASHPSYLAFLWIIAFHLWISYDRDKRLLHLYDSLWSGQFNRGFFLFSFFSLKNWEFLLVACQILHKQGERNTLVAITVKKNKILNTHAF